jgi:hypothetical protein
MALLGGGSRGPAQAERAARLANKRIARTITADKRFSDGVGPFSGP